jgi:hypothetical protein
LGKEIAVATTEQLVDLIALELVHGIDTAVECWMSQVNQALTNPRLTTLGRLSAVTEVMNQYKLVTGKSDLMCRSQPVRPLAATEGFL